MSAYVDSTGVTYLTADIKALADTAYPANAAIAEEYDSTASYSVGDFCIYEGLFYKCNTAIASGGETWNSSHWTATNVADNLGTNSGSSDGALYFTSVAVSATTGDIATVTDAAITADYVLASIVFANVSAVTTNVTWTTSSSSLVLNGTCTTATTADIVLIKKSN